MKKEIPLPDDWIEGINARFPDDLKARAIEIVRNPDTLPALRILAERGYDDIALYEALRLCAYWSSFPVRADGPFSNKSLMRSAEEAARTLHTILAGEIDGTDSRIASVTETIRRAGENAVRKFNVAHGRDEWESIPRDIPVLDDKTILRALRMVEEYFGTYACRGRKGPDLRQHGLMRGLDRHLLHGKKKTIQTEKVYEAIALLRRASFGGREVKATSIKKEVERSRLQYPPASERNK